GQNVTSIVAFGNGDSRIILTPAVPLSPATTYTLTIGAVSDLSGQPLATAQVRHFTTASGVDFTTPLVTSTSPGNGALNVPTNALIQVAFSERMDPETVHSGTFVVYPQSTGIPIAASYLVAADGRSATLVPASPLRPSTDADADAFGQSRAGHGVHNHRGELHRHHRELGDSIRQHVHDRRRRGRQWTADRERVDAGIRGSGHRRQHDDRRHVQQGGE